MPGTRVRMPGTTSEAGAPTTRHTREGTRVHHMALRLDPASLKSRLFEELYLWRRNFGLAVRPTARDAEMNCGQGLKSLAREGRGTTEDP